MLAAQSLSLFFLLLCFTLRLAENKRVLLLPRAPAKLVTAKINIKFLQPLLPGQHRHKDKACRSSILRVRMGVCVCMGEAPFVSNDHAHVHLPILHLAPLSASL